MAKRKITWTKSAIIQLNHSVKYIRKESPQNAEKVKYAILEKIGELESTMIVHRVDPLKKKNDGHFLYFEILKHRISFHFSPKEVIIVRVRHTRMNPKKY